MNFLKSVGFAVVLWLLAAGVGGGVAKANPALDQRAVEYIVGTVAAILVATRERYDPDWQGWVLLFLGPLGWVVAFWRRFNQLDRRRAQARPVAG